MKVDYNIIKRELENLSKEEIKLLRVLFPSSCAGLYTLYDYSIKLSDLFGINTIRNRHFLPKKEALYLIHSLKLKSNKEYQKWRVDNKRIDLPSDPITVYNVTWEELLGNKHISNRRTNYLPVEEAMIRFLKKLSNNDI